MRRSESGLGFLGGIISLAGDSAGEAEVACMEGVRVLARLSWRLVDKVDILRGGAPGEVADFVPLAAPFSFVTKPLSWAN